jgi:hypothetical protein
MSDQDDNTPAKIQQRDKGKLKEEEGNTAPSKRMNSKSADDNTNEPMIIRPVPLKYTKVSILPSHLKLKRKKKTTNRESKITE